MPRRFLPPVLLLLAALCWSLGGVLIKSIDWPPMAIAGGRSDCDPMTSSGGRRASLFARGRISAERSGMRERSSLCLRDADDDPANAIFSNPPRRLRRMIGPGKWASALGIEGRSSRGADGLRFIWTADVAVSGATSSLG